MVKIQNIEVYNESMRKSLLDKIFFMDKIDSLMFIDYGCADGSMLDFLNNLFPEYKYFGYDISQEMLDIASRKNDAIIFSNSWNDILSRANDTTALILSSVIHEIYDYSGKKEIDEFWKRVFNNKFEYIIIRDMMISKSCERKSDINDIIKLRNLSNSDHLGEFENKWGSIDNNKNLIHFLLKYKYEANWSREVNENYLPLNFENFLTFIPHNYEVIFHEHYVLPHIRKCAKEDFGINIIDNTHAKFILKYIG
jgi:hypothetical protein